jgi:hypothetical protein
MTTPLASQVRGSKHTVTGVSEYILGNGVDCWVVMRVNERGEKWPQLFPKFTLEQRIAEYDLDPSDIAGALDMVLYEPDIPDPTDSRNFAGDAAAKAGHTLAAVRGFGRISVGAMVPLHLGNSPDRATARDAHQLRIADAKTRMTIQSGKGAGILSKNDATDPLLTITSNHGVDLDRVKARAAYVDALIADRQGKTGVPRMMIPGPGSAPVFTPTLQRDQLPYDDAVRRRGLTVALLDNP